MPLNPQPPLPRQRIDFSDLSSATQELQKLVDALDGMVDDVADARTALDYDSERKKNSLAKATVKAFTAGSKSAANAEVVARTDATYLEEIENLKNDYAQAERVRLRYEVLRIKADACRTLVSAQKSIAHL